jgi:hypothetical protein
MGKYIQYKRISKVATVQELDDIFKKIISDGMEIISYHETILEKNKDIERLAVAIVYGKLNEGYSDPKLQLLNS